ncbi:hypothetical protein HK405_011482, partial [Cladochytrium tenue]
MDLKSLNLLVAADWTCKVADFGIAATVASSRTRFRRLLLADAGTADAEAAVAETDEGAPAHGGTLQWMAPELLGSEDGDAATDAARLRTAALSTKADVYAFGVVLWEVATRRKPWLGVRPRDICRRVATGERPCDSPPTPPPPTHSSKRPSPAAPPPPPPVAAPWPAAFAALVEGCWHQDPRRRPEFADCVRRLSRIDVPGDAVAAAAGAPDVGRRGSRVQAWTVAAAPVVGGAATVDPLVRRDSGRRTRGMATLPQPPPSLPSPPLRLASLPPTPPNPRAPPTASATYPTAAAAPRVPPAAPLRSDSTIAVPLPQNTTTAAAAIASAKRAAPLPLPLSEMRSPSDASSISAGGPSSASHFFWSRSSRGSSATVPATAPASATTPADSPLSTAGTLRRRRSTAPYATTTTTTTTSGGGEDDAWTDTNSYASTPVPNRRAGALPAAARTGSSAGSRVRAPLAGHIADPNDALDWRLARHIYLSSFSGERRSLASICEGQKTVIVFLRR